MGQMSQRVLFLRRYRAFQGGHLKVWDYFQHVRSAEGVTPSIWFAPDSVWDDANPWTPMRDRVLSSWTWQDADILFLAGMDWQFLDESNRQRSPIPVINLIQHVRHADPGDKRRPFLSHKAIRICVSQEVADAIQQTGLVNGPVFVIPNGIDLGLLPPVMPYYERDIDVLVVGTKQPSQAARVGRQFRAEVLTDRVPRTEFLRTLARSRTVVFLPNPTEGFYLPALEAMALGCVVICPDCVGNRGFCLDGENCLRPDYQADAIRHAITRAQSMTEHVRLTLIETARHTAAQHGLDHERTSFLSILRQTHQIWANASS